LLLGRQQRVFSAASLTHVRRWLKFASEATARAGWPTKQNKYLTLATAEPPELSGSSLVKS
jgi:hypothetical protein